MREAGHHANDAAAGVRGTRTRGADRRPARTRHVHPEISYRSHVEPDGRVLRRDARVRKEAELAHTGVRADVAERTGARISRSQGGLSYRTAAPCGPRADGH